MTPEQAVARVLLVGDGWRGDCADLCLLYLGELRGVPQPRPDAAALTPRAVSAVLGRPRRGAPRFGDVVMSGGGLGVYLVYCVLTSDESTRRMARAPVPRTLLAWGVGRG